MYCSGAVATYPRIKPNKTEQNRMGRAQFGHSFYAETIDEFMVHAPALPFQQDINTLIIVADTGLGDSENLDFFITLPHHAS